MKVVLAAAEVQGFIKTGGLGDVMGALPKKLVEQGVQVSVFLPKYGQIPAEMMRHAQRLGSFTIHLGWREQYCGVLSLVQEGVTYYLIDNEYYFKRDTPYGHFDDGERFAFFCRSVLEALKHLELQPDVIHCHDWHTALIPVMLHNDYCIDPFYKGIRTVFTIHNLQFQGRFSMQMKGDVLDMADRTHLWEKLEQEGDINWMKGGIIYADRVTTVSPTYLQEILQPYFGCGLDGVLGAYRDKLSGILNGVDYDLYNPATDRRIYARYRSSLETRSKNKLQLQQDLALPVDRQVPLVGMVTRLTEQKGIDLVLAVLREMMGLGIQLVILGTGDAAYEQQLGKAAQQYHQQMRALITFDDGMARRIYAASDLFLMPSKFEPCGISQMIAMHYMALPLVRETGGLKDTVQPYNQYTGEGNGFSFANYNAHEMLTVLENAVTLYREQPGVFARLVQQARQCDFSWERSAKEYVALYRSLVQR